MKKDDILIRNIRQEEFDEVCKFTSKRNETKSFEDIYERWRLDKDTYVMVVDKKIVGMVCYHISSAEDKVNLFYLIVRKKYRRRGYGLELMEHLFSFSKRWRKSKLKFRCRVGSKSNKFFKKNYGYKSTFKIEENNVYECLIP